MRTIISVLFVSIIAGSCAISSYPNGNNWKNADRDFVMEQAKFFELLQHPHQPGVSTYTPEYLNIVNSFDVEKYDDNFSNVEAVKEFFYYYQKGLMPYNELFSIYNEYHRQQAIALIRVFNYTKDCDIFYKAALWARYNVNPGLFVYALHVAIVHRPGAACYELPAIYEISPHYFFNFDVIQRAQMYKQRGFYGIKKVDGVYNVVLYANYSDYKVYSYEDEKLSYFTEDIGLNSYYYYFHINYPFWMGGKEFGLHKDRRGEYFLYVHQQLLARYYLERLSHDMEAIKVFTWETPLQSYHPNIRTYDGYPFISRDDKHIIYQEDNNHYTVDYIYAYEQRLLDAVDSGYSLLENGTHFYFGDDGGYEYLGNLLQGNPDSLNGHYYNYMDSVFKTFGHYFGKYQQTVFYPSVLHLPETALRDPAYWSFMKRVSMFANKFTSNLKPYPYKEIGFKGVKIKSVNTDKLLTSLEYFDADISNAVDVERYKLEDLCGLGRYGRHSCYNGKDYLIKARQKRLNHVPFKVNISVVSKVAVPAVVRMYLGPKYDEYGHLLPLNENRYNFVMLDKFKYNLKLGNNLITRMSTQFHYKVKDRTTYFDLYKKLMLAYVDNKPYQMDDSEAHSGFPQRLILPMGKNDGLTYQLFIHISPYRAPQNPHDRTDSRYLDSLPLYYPLDRPIDEYTWYTSNMYYYDVKIFHQSRI